MYGERISVLVAGWGGSTAATANSCGPSDTGRHAHSSCNLIRSRTDRITRRMSPACDDDEHLDRACSENSLLSASLKNISKADVAKPNAMRTYDYCYIDLCTELMANNFDLMITKRRTNVSRCVLETHLFWGQKVKGQVKVSHKNNAGVCLYTLVAGIYRLFGGVVLSGKMCGRSRLSARTENRCLSSVRMSVK